MSKDRRAFLLSNLMNLHPTNDAPEHVKSAYVVIKNFIDEVTTEKSADFEENMRHYLNHPDPSGG